MRRLARPHTTISPEAYDRQRAGWHEDRRIEMILPLLPTEPGSLVVELGCGSGRFLDRLARREPAHQYLGIDIDAGLVDHAQQHRARPGLQFEVDDVTAGWSHGCPQMLVSIDVLHHVDDTPTLYAALHRHLAPGAAWLIFEPNIWHVAVTLSQERMKRAGLGEDHFRPRREMSRLRSAAFDIEWRRYLLAAPQADRPPRFERLLRFVERVPVAGSSVAVLTRKRS
jgi:trans-aconitate methyltransferase